MSELQDPLHPIVRIKKLDPLATPPSYAKHGDAGMDVYANHSAHIEIGETRTISTGIAIEIPYGYFGSGRERSGLAAKGIRLGGGVIDSGYRGEVRAILTNLGFHSFLIVPVDRIFQIVIQPCAYPTIEVVQELSKSERGAAGFGSTGK